MPVPDRKLSKNFSLSEFLYSSTAQRFPEILRDQNEPSENTISNLSYLCNMCLQPIRESFNYPIRITSGYRCEALNTKVGSTNRSQHLFGQAVDCVVSDKFLRSSRSSYIRDKIEQIILEITGKPVREDVNANYYLFAYVCLRKNRFDIDQVIHEYGHEAGRPAWVHIACSPSPQNKGQILAFGQHFDGSIDRPNLIDALNYGV